MSEETSDRAIPATVSGIWTGQIVSLNEHNISNNNSSSGSSSSNFISQNHTMVLSLLNTPLYPSGYGAIITDAHGRGGGGEPVVPWIVHGNWDHENNIFTAKVITPEVVINFAGSLSWRHDVLYLKGLWTTQGERVISGTFSYKKEGDNPDVHVSGLWEGNAVPAEELSEFGIPANPVNWSLALVKPHLSVETPCAFGCGFFNDSGDVPDQPVLFYTLFGKIDHRSPTIKITKTYEKHAETEGYDVEYDANFEQTDQGFTLKGTWKNQRAGSHGSFSCVHHAL